MSGKYINRLPRSMPADQTRALSDVFRDLHRDTADVLTQLANADNSALGDALVAVQRSETGAVATTQHAANANRPLCLKTDFGAAMDGTTDDATAVQAWIDAGVSLGRKLVAPDGVCMLGQQIEITGAVDIEGAGWGTVFKSTAAGTHILFLVQHATYAAITGVRMANFCVDGNSRGQLDSGLIQCNNVVGFLIDRLWIKNGSRVSGASGINGIAFSVGSLGAAGQPLGTIRDCLIEGNSKAGINYTTEGLGALITGNVVRNNTGNGSAPGIQINGGYNVRVVGNQVYGNQGRGIYMATDGNNRSPRYAIVAFNHVYDNGQGTSEGEGIAIANATATVFGRVNIVGNTVHSNGSGLTGGAAGIVVQNDEHVVVQSNYIYNNRLHGILVQDSSNTIKQCFIAGNVIENNNQVNNSEGSGIYITGDIERLKISNNQIVDNQGTPTQKWAGFFTSTALVTDLTIEDNDCQGHTNAANWSFDGSGAITRMRLSLDWRHQTTAGSASNTLPIPIPDNSAVKIRSHVVGVQSDGSNRAGYERVALVYRDGAGATIQGTVAAPFTEESAAGWDSTIVVSSNVFTPQVTGAAATTINWRGVLEAVSI